MPLNFEKIRIPDIVAIEPIADIIKTRKVFLKNVKKLCERRLEGSPAGRLRVSSDKNRCRFYWVNNETNKSGEYIKRQNIDLARSLAQKFYDQKILELVTVELKELDRMDSIYQAMNRSLAEKYYDCILEAKKQLIVPFNMTDTEFVSHWSSEPYVTKGFSDTDKIHKNYKNECFRSKSEVLISEMYDAAGIPYKYEYPVRFSNGSTVYVDFLLLDVSTRKQYYHEHFGMMDNPDYAKKAILKIQEYQKKGIILGVNLIATFETSDVPFDSTKLLPIIRSLFK